MLTFHSETNAITHIIPIFNWQAGLYILQCLNQEGQVVYREKFIVH